MDLQHSARPPTPSATPVELNEVVSLSPPPSPPEIKKKNEKMKCDEKGFNDILFGLYLVAYLTASLLPEPVF